MKSASMTWCLMAIGLSWAALGCTDDGGCSDYVDAYNLCQQAAGESALLDLETTCSVADDSLKDLHTCLTAAYTENVCGTSAGYQAAETAAADCRAD